MYRLSKSKLFFLAIFCYYCSKWWIVWPVEEIKARQEEVKKAGMDWFLYRWLLARNICTFFCLVLIIVHIIILF